MGVAGAGQTPYWLLQGLKLDHRANIVSLDFGVLDFTSPKRNHIAYRMAGLTDRWIDLGTQHRITLTNLDAGDHLLEVRAANSDSRLERYAAAPDASTRIRRPGDRAGPTRSMRCWRWA